MPFPLQPRSGKPDARSRWLQDLFWRSLGVSPSKYLSAKKRSGLNPQAGQELHAIFTRRLQARHPFLENLYVLPANL
ncbi:hypothetical protein [Collimonas fungivorans]|uniref:hypothetical protein n=1 Tax=Collimonas fungivorans TaxID=158899 RepID=UPI003FA38424